MSGDNGQYLRRKENRCDDWICVETEQGIRHFRCGEEKGHNGNHLRSGEDLPINVRGQSESDKKMLWRVEWPVTSGQKPGTGRRCPVRCRPITAAGGDVIFQCEIEIRDTQNAHDIHVRTSVDLWNDVPWRLSWTMNPNSSGTKAH